ncbi:MAG: hypothetical protein LC105_07465 [Chitinophagales bacterium]|nr:hypothetical protein [Chitinophagales bacterium]
MPIYEGAKIGLIVSLAISPSLLLVINYSINRGYQHALLFCSGMWSSDIIHALIFTLILDRVFYIIQINQLYFSLILSIVLFLIGCKLFLQSDLTTNNPNIKISPFLFVNGFLYAVLSPGSSMIWFGIISYSHKFEFNNFPHLLYILSFMLVVITADTIKVLLASKLSTFLKTDKIKKINKASAILLILTGCLILVKTIIN